MRQPDTHEEIAIMLIAKWEYEDEIRAIEEILAETRQSNVNAKRQLIQKDGVKIKRKKNFLKTKNSLNPR